MAATSVIHADRARHRACAQAAARSSSFRRRMSTSFDPTTDRYGLGIKTERAAIARFASKRYFSPTPAQPGTGVLEQTPSLGIRER